MSALSTDVWSKIHGASTHFPIAMVFGACAFDLLAIMAWGKPLARNASAAGLFAIALGALGGILAVVSGINLTKGEMMGSGALRWHHMFVWPAFAMMVAAAIWRFLVADKFTRRSYVVYFALELILTALTAASGFWGGEMLQGVS